MSPRGRIEDAATRFVTEVQASPFARRGLLLALAIAVLGQWYLHIDGWSTIPATDVRVYAQGGRWALEHWDIYSPAFPSAFTGFLPFSYPPFGAVVMIPLGMLPDAWLIPVWTLVSLVCLVGVILVAFAPLLQRVTGWYRGLAVAVGVFVLIPTGPISEVLPFGQIGIVLTLACLLDVVGRTWRVPQGVLVGLMTAVKLTPGLFIVHWVVTRQWRAALTSTATVVVCWIIGALWLPTSTRVYVWTDRLIVNPTARAARPDLEFNQSIGGVLARLHDGVIPSSSYLPLALALCVAGLAVASVAHRAGGLVTTAAVVGLTSVVVAPVSWTHHAVWLIPALGALVGEGRSVRRVAASVALLACLYYPSRGWLPIETRFGFQEVWFTLYCLTIAVLGVVAWRAVRGRSVAY